MAKYLVTGFSPESGGDITVNGVIIDGDSSFVFSTWNVRFDHTSATPIRQQIDVVLAEVATQQFANYGHAPIVLTQADIEYLI